MELILTGAVIGAIPAFLSGLWIGYSNGHFDGLLDGLYGDKESA